MLKLKQQQLQLMIRQVKVACAEAEANRLAAQDAFAPARHLLADTAGVNVAELAKPVEVVTDTENVAGVNIPVFKDVIFSEVTYSLFGTPAWVDRVLAQMQDISRCQAKFDILDKQRRLLQQELTKIIQRVNLFEKVKIPEAKEAIRVIQIKLGDEMTAAVGRGKIAKSKLTSTSHASESPSGMEEPVQGGVA